MINLKIKLLKKILNLLNYHWAICPYPKNHYINKMQKNFKKNQKYIQKNNLKIKILKKIMNLCKKNQFINKMLRNIKKKQKCLIKK